jgi:hypothetical protein
VGELAEDKEIRDPPRLARSESGGGRGDKTDAYPGRSAALPEIWLPHSVTARDGAAEVSRGHCTVRERRKGRTDRHQTLQEGSEGE